MSGRLSAAMLLLLFQISVAFAQEWPARPIHAIVPQSPGSSLDIVPRAVFEQLSGKLGQPIIVENRVGAGNTIAMAAVARADPDGYTILVNSSTHTLVPVTYPNLPFDALRDLVPVIPIGNVPLVLMVSASKGYKSVADLVAAAKAKHGNMNYASGGAGSSTHFSAEAFRLAAGFQAVHIPQKGAPEALTEVLAERADFYFPRCRPHFHSSMVGSYRPWQSAARSGPSCCRRRLPFEKRAIRRPNSISGLPCSRRRRSLPRSLANCVRRPQRSLIIRQCRRGWRDWASIHCRSIPPRSTSSWKTRSGSTPAWPTP
jgi:hypothetical protein